REYLQRHDRNGESGSDYNSDGGESGFVHLRSVGDTDGNSKSGRGWRISAIPEWGHGAGIGGDQRWTSAAYNDRSAGRDEFANRGLRRRHELREQYVERGAADGGEDYVQHNPRRESIAGDAGADRDVVSDGDTRDRHRDGAVL